ncbi:MAG: type II toxin-antitoxin system antitoxin SocA domain-containing protein [Pseudomonadota bacterium]
MLTSRDVARYFLTQANPEFGDGISNLKLQKLVYYAQGFHLALFESPLFNESIEAWEHGPVVPMLYHAYKEHGAGAIPVPDDINFDIYDQQTQELLNEVYSVYGQYAAWKLRNMTHEEAPWKIAYEKHHTITQESMKDYFKKLIN